MRQILILLLIVFVMNMNGQNKKRISNFSLSISTYNHAGRIFDGVMTYTIKNNTLTIRRNSMTFTTRRKAKLTNKDTLLLTKKIETNAIDLIKEIRIDTLQNFYFNYCIMETSGSEYFVSTSTGSANKKISLHHYYNQEIERLINELNKNIPEELKLNYVAMDIKQDCKPY